MEPLVEILTSLFSRYELESQGFDAYIISSSPVNPYYSLSHLGIARHFLTRTGQVYQRTTVPYSPQFQSEDGQDVQREYP